MSTQPGPTIMSAAIGAGFRDDALLTIVAIGHRESGWDDTAQGDLTLMDGEWGPSVGVWQIRTLNAQQHSGGDRDIFALIPGATIGQPGSGRGDLGRQAAAAWTISSHGTNFGAWSTFRGLPQADRDAAQSALSSMSPSDIQNAIEGKTTKGAGGVVGGSGGGLGDLLSGDGLANAMDKAMGAVLGYDGTFSEWAAMVAIRSLEVIGGGLILAAGAIVFLDVVFSGRDHAPAARGSSIVASAVRKGVTLAKTAATVAAA